MHLGCAPRAGALKRVETGATLAPDSAAHSAAQCRWAEGAPSGCQAAPLLGLVITPRADGSLQIGSGLLEFGIISETHGSYEAGLALEPWMMTWDICSSVEHDTHEELCLRNKAGYVPVVRESRRAPLDRLSDSAIRGEDCPPNAEH